MSFCCIWEPPSVLTHRLGEAGRGAHVSVWVPGSRTDSVIASSSPCLQKQLCVLSVHTRVLGEKKDWRAKTPKHDLNFTVQGKRASRAVWKLSSWPPRNPSPRKAFGGNNKRDNRRSLVKDQLSQGVKRMLRQ